MMKPISEFYPLLKAGPAHVVVTFHQKPDADALGSALGLQHYLELIGHKVAVVSPTNWAGFLHWMPGAGQVVDFDSRRPLGEELVRKADWVFCLDFNTLSRTKAMETPLRETSALRILIDHHQEPEVACFQYGISDTGKCSTAEMVYDFIVATGGAALINEPIAECLYAGIMTDTGSFRFPSTTASAHRMVAHLKDTGFLHHRVHENIYDNYLENRLRFIGNTLLNRMEVIYELNTVLIAVPKSDIQRFDIVTGDTEGLVNFPLSIQGIKMAAIVIDRDEERKWSFRSKGAVDVNTFARTYFQGGGHHNAAGGRSSDSLEKTVEHFRNVIHHLKDVLA